MRLTLRDKQFVLKSATLSATIRDPYWLRVYGPNEDPRPSWSFELKAERETEGEGWEPRVFRENLHLPIRTWMEVDGQSVEWSERFDEETGEPNGDFYVLEHGDIPRARLTFSKRDGARFEFEWTGECDVFGGDKYDQDVPFTASGWADFTGVTVLGSESDTDETVRKRLGAFLDWRDFVQEPLSMSGHRYGSGVKIAKSHFAPSL